jgi:hypothetical protein
MKNFWFTCLVCLASLPALAGGAGTASPKGKRPATYEVIKSEFGLFKQTPAGAGAFVPTRQVPLIANQAYGWIVALRTDKPTLRWREEFELPTRPDSWGPPAPEGRRRISANGRVAISERRVAPVNGMIFNTWAVAPGDPVGTYRIRVYVEGRLVDAFEFQVQAPAAEAVPEPAATPAAPAPSES